MARCRVRSLVLGSTLVGLLIGAALISAQVDRPGAPPTAPGTVEWRFIEPQPDWNPGLPLPDSQAPGLERTTDGLRVILSDRPRTSGQSPRNRTLSGGIYVDLPDWRREQWAEVVVRARSTAVVSSMEIGLNPWQGVLPAGATQATFQARGGVTPIVRDGLVHTYRIHLDWGDQRTGPWRRVGLQFQAPVRVPAPVSASIDILSVRVVPAIAGQDQVVEMTLEPPQMKSDFAFFRKALEEAHPSLYRYTTKRELDAEFARAEAMLTRPMTILQFRNVLAPVLAAIKDEHTEFTSYQGDEISAVVGSSKLFPLALAFESERAVVVLNRGRDERVRPGMEVLAINGQSLPEILRRILPNLPRDGDIRTRQMYELGMSEFVRPWTPSGTAKFSEAYRLYIGDPSRFRTTLRDPQTGRTVDVDLGGITNAAGMYNEDPAVRQVNQIQAYAQLEQNPANRDVLAGIKTLRDLGPRQSIRYFDSEDTAVLLVAAFGGNFPDFLKATFAGLRSKGTKNLIIDLRGCTGGSAPYVGLLFSYLTPKEFRQVERVYAKTNAPSFRQYTSLGEVDPATDSYWGRWTPDPNGGWLKTEQFPIMRVQRPSENVFAGPVYVLIDGGTISAGSMFSALADFHKRATFIGEETGGAAEGGAAVGAAYGELSPTLPASHLNVDIPAEAEFNFVDPNNRRRGTLPKHAVRQTVDDLVKGRDTVLEFTRELIRSGKGR